MSNKRLSLLRSLSLTGIGLSRISIKVTFYVAIAATTLVLFGSVLVVFNQNPLALFFYLTIMLLFISLQIQQLLRRDREQTIQDQFQIDVEHFLRTGTRPK